MAGRAAVLFDVGGPIDMEFAWEMAVDGAIAAACGMEGVRVDQAMVEDASDAAVAAFAPDTYGHMIETLCGGDPYTVSRVRHRVEAMTGALDAFQLRPDIDRLLRKLHASGVVLVVEEKEEKRLVREGLVNLFSVKIPPSAPCVVVGDRLDRDIAPARARGLATIQFRTGRWRKQRPRSAAETPDAVVTDVPELEAALATLL
jgi:phosphoglycolate phosphatase-like HAD superfamily hydrolase